MNQPLQLLAISGSLRAASSNTAVLQALATLAPVDITITLYDQLGELPHFNPDLDGETEQLPTTVITADCCRKKKRVSSRANPAVRYGALCEFVSFLLNHQQS